MYISHLEDITKMIKNIYKRRDGRFEGRITLGYQDGKRQYKAFFGADEETVAAK